MAIPIISVAQMREWEQATWATGQTEKAVIDLVGRAIAARLLELTCPNDAILVIAGKGHNGDDARAAVVHLAERKVTLINVNDPNAAQEQFTHLQRNGFAFIIDALFGIGLSRPLNTAWQGLINTVNESRIPIISIDVPSGLNAETGEAEGAAIHAAITLTVGAPKRGMLVLNAVPFVGRLETLTDIGLIPPIHQSELQWMMPSDFAHFPPPRSVAAHKGSFGHVAVVAGSLGYHGAAVLAARGALKAQPGLVSVFTQENVYMAVASQLQAAMVHPWRAATLLPKNTTAVLFGPGLAAEDLPETFKKELRSLWKNSPLPVIADASALDWLPTGTTVSPDLRFVTPHPGEAARLLKQSTEAVQNDRVTALRNVSKHFGDCWVILKGHQTLIGRSNGDIVVNSSGNSFLAQGGSGDVLAGFIAGLLAQPTLARDVAQTIKYAVWRHGAAADENSSRLNRWTVDDLVSAL